MAKKTALITGCSAGGIGAALAKQLAGNGYDVIATVRKRDKAGDLNTTENVKVINLSSVAGVVAAPLNGLYAASKWALEALSETFRYELGHWNIRVHLIEPGRIETPFSGNRVLVGAAAGEESPYSELVTMWDTVNNNLGARARAEDVANAIVEAIEVGDKFRYPVGQDAAMITGARKAMTFEQFESAMRTQLQLTW